MHYKSFGYGILVGIVIASIGFWIFGDTLRGEVADTTKTIGKTVEKAGETIQNGAKKLDR